MIDRVLVADDDFLVRQVVEETVKRHGIEVITADSGEEAIECLKRHDFQMAFVDLKMGKSTGLDVLKFCKKKCPNVIFVIMTAYGTIETAVEAMRTGAFDFIIKPFSPDQADFLIEKAAKWCQLQERNIYLTKELTTRQTFSKQIIGSSEKLQGITRLIQRVAPTTAAVLVTGESGTGKELVAGEINAISDPSGEKPYIRMNCAAVPENLLESELFGHEKGSFTGATERRIGRFELADGGTILLDEIGEISMGMQSKLLRVLQESEFERVGGNKTIKVNVRVIATTNRNLKNEVAENNFREDLYYRLNVFPIQLPPLRERDRDVVDIAKECLAKQEVKLGRKLAFSKNALNYIQNYPWPGNIRELENVVERVAILDDGPTIEAHSLPKDILNPTSVRLSFSNGKNDESIEDLLNIKEIERLTIKKALLATNGNRSKAADLLGFSVRTLRNKLNEYDNDDQVNDDVLTATM